MSNGDELPSQTALTAAAARAAHLVVDGDPPIFVDSLAATLLGDRVDELVGFHRAHGAHLVLSTARGQVVCRARYAEDRVAEVVGRGVTQYVILGAGLDSFAYRSTLAERVRIVEVDHPAMQAAKRAALAAAGAAIPDTVTFVAIDVESDSLADCLVRGGLDPSRPAVVSWLGVTMYLTRAAISRVLATIGGLAPGTELIADYMLPAGHRDATGDGYVEHVAPVAAQHGEPWQTFLTPDEMSTLLDEHGLRAVRHVRQIDTVDPALWDRCDPLRPVDLSVIAHATIASASPT